MSNPVPADTPTGSARPSVLFVCVHNAGRSQMAAMAELGIDMSAEVPKVLTTEAVRASDVVITMGCGDECPYFPGKRYEDWILEDPAGRGVEFVRPIRDEIRARVEALIADLAPAEP